MRRFLDIFNLLWYNLVTNILNQENKMKSWTGEKIDNLEKNQIFVFGSNPVL